MSNKNHLGLVLMGFIFAPPALAASFDCTRAATAVEKLICADAQLSRSDEALAASYASALKQTADPAALRKTQREWIGAARDRCADAECLRAAYAARIAELASIEKAHAPSGAKDGARASVPPVKSDAEACRVVADYAGRGMLDKLLMDSIASPLSREQAMRVFGNEFIDNFVGNNDDVRYWSLDLDNDGVRDHLAIVAQGSERVGTAYWRSGRTGSAVGEVGDEEGRDLSVLSVGGRNYVLSGGRFDEFRPNKLWRLSRDGKPAVVCAFSPRKEPRVEIVVGKDNPLCPKIRRGSVPHVSFGLEHALGPLPRDRFDSMAPKDGLARVDIDNDGQPDNVVRLDFFQRGGRPCQFIVIAVTDATRTTIPDTKLNALLLDQIGGSYCGPDLDVLVYQGLAYVDADTRDGGHTIYRIKDGKAETTCQIKARPIYDVAEPK